jgi:6-methylsalicylate decarboxylase
MARLDLHAHVIPDEYRALLPAQGYPLPPATLEDLTETMARYGIDGAVVSTGPPGASVDDCGRAAELARSANERIADIVRDAPERFAGLAILPLPDLDRSLAELRHALDVLKLDGVALFTNVGGTYLGDPAWDPLFDELQRRGAYVFVHPVHGPYPPPLSWPVWLYEFPFDTTRAIVQLLYSGTLERCPSLRIQVAHLGGTAPFLAHRIASLAEREPHLAEQAPAGALEYLSRLYYDTGLSNNDVALASTLAAVPLDRVVFGTDWPYAALPEGDDPAPALGLDAEQRWRVDAVNAAALVPRLAATHAR